MLQLKATLDHNNSGNAQSMGQPKSIENKANDVLSPSILASGQLKNQIQTSTNVEYFDNSKGSTNGVINGKTAQIKFTRADDLTKSFFLQKRAGGVNPKDNVFELYSNTPTVGALNAMFLGVDGLKKFSNISISAIYANIDTTQTNSIRNGTIQLVMTTNGVLPTYPSLFILDARAALKSDAKSGIISILNGDGTDGYSGLAYNNLSYIYVTSTGLKLGGSLTPDGTTYNIGSASAGIAKYYVNNGVFWSSGAGSPEAVVTAPVGSLYSRTDGGATTTLYVKTSGSGNTGWTAK